MAGPEAGLELPIGLTEQKFLQQLARIEAKAIGSARKAEQAFVKGNAQIGKSFGTMSGQARAGLQNVSYQMQDIFVQIQGGQGATRALSQQLPQLLSGFGVVGAAMGTVAAIAIPLAASFIQTGDGADELAKATDEAQKAMAAFRVAMENADVSAAELQTRFGEMSGAARQMLTTLAETAEARAIIKQGAAVDALQGRFAELTSMVQTYNNLLSSPDALYQADAVTWLEQINKQYGLTIPQAERLLEVVDDIDSASGSERAAMLADISTILKEAAKNGGMVDEEMINLTDSAAQAALAVAEIDNANFGNAVAQVDTLAARLGNLIAQANGAAAALNAAGVFVGSDGSVQTGARGRDASTDWRFEDPGKDYDTLGERRAREAAAKAAAEAREARAGAAGAGGGGSKGGGSGRMPKAETPFFANAERDLQNLDRQLDLIGKSNEEVATAKARWELLDEVKRRGIPLNAELSAQIDAQASQFGRLTGELERAEASQQQFEQAVDGIADAFAGALVAGESLREGLAQVFKQIASDILNSGIQNALSGAFGGGGFNPFALFGGGDALSGALRGAGLPARAMGGPVTGGQPYLVGERGPEIVVPGASGNVIPNHKIGGGGGDVNVRVFVDDEGKLRSVIEQVSGNVSARAVQQGISSYDKGMPARIQKVQVNPRRR